MKRRLEQLSLLLIMMFMVTTNAWSGGNGGNSKTYYAEAIVKTSDADKGKVYVEKFGANSTKNFQAESTATANGTSSTINFSAYAKAELGYKIEGWYENDVLFNNQTEDMLAIEIENSSEDENNPTERTFTAKFTNLTELSAKAGNWYSNNTGEIQNFGEIENGVIEIYCGNSQNAEGKVLYQKLTGLKNGFYNIEFEVAASAAQWKAGGVTSGSALAEAYIMNEDTEIYTLSLDVVNRSEADGNISNYEPITIQQPINVIDGTLEYGIRVPEGAPAGNWFTCKPISLTRLDVDANLAISADAKWGTFCAPFDVEIPEGVTAYTVQLDSNNELVKTEVSDKMEAYVPYLVHNDIEKSIILNFSGMPKEETAPQGGDFIGNTGEAEDLPSDGSIYVLQKQGDVVGFFPVKNEGMKIGTNRCYLITSSSVEAKAFYALDGDEATGLNSLSEKTTDAAIFDLSGRRVSAAQKGLYIKNGKKVFVK